MPIHDWTRVTAGTFHDFHVAWIAELRRALNAGLLPEGYYAMAEQVANSVIPDVLTLQGMSGSGGDVKKSGVSGEDWREGNGGGLAVAEAPPQVQVSDTISEALILARRRRHLVIRHTTGDRVVALLEIVSPGNKERKGALEAFVDKATSALDDGFHLMILDLFPPGPCDPAGMHGAVWQHLGGTYRSPAGKPLTLAAYAASAPGLTTCYVEPTAVGDILIPMPLFLDPGHYINVPLESTYLAAYEGVPKRWKQVIEVATPTP